MHIVAITRLATDLADAAKDLAEPLGTLPYEVRLKLAVGIPAVVLTIADEARAATAAAAIRKRGHDVVCCDADDIADSSAMVQLRRMQFEPDALVATQPLGNRLAWSDLATIIRAGHRTVVETQQTEKARHFSIGRAALSGGLVISKEKSKTITKRAEDSEGVLYLFPRTGGVPWLLRERNAAYDALGDGMSPSSAHNFALVVDAIRTRARGAAFDDRLVARKGPPHDVDVLAHIIASSIGAAGASPFR